MEEREMRTFDLSRQERSSVLEGIAKELAGRKEILFAYAHGSFLGEGPFRDLDLAVYLYPEMTPDRPFHYEDELAASLARQLKLAFPVDVRILNGAPVSFRYHVFQGRLLCETDSAARIDIVVHTLARYFDFAPFLGHYLKDAYGCET